MTKGTYTLKDIHRVLRFAPPIFIIILGLLSFVITYLSLEKQKSSEIALLVQKNRLEQAFLAKTRLNSYIDSIEEKIDADLKSIKNSLKNRVYHLHGSYNALKKTSLKNDIYNLKPFIKKVENNNPIKIVIFDTKLNVFYGLQTVKNIQELIFSKRDDLVSQRITLLYILSQGPLSSFTWRDDPNDTIQLSFFLKSKDGKFFMGAFSLADSLRNLHIQNFIHSMQSRNTPSKNHHFWLYDHSKKSLFNYDDNQKWQITKPPKASFPSFYYDKHLLSVGIKPSLSLQERRLTAKVDKVKEAYTAKLHQGTALITFIAIVLITFTALFSSFIKRIFNKYNRQFEQKNRQLAKLKERYELAVIASNDGLWDTNFKTNKTFFSKKWLTMLGYKSGDIASYEEWFDLLHVKDKEVISKALYEHIHNPKSEHLISEYRLKAKDGTYKWVLGRGKVFKDEKGKPKRLLMMTMDINQSKRTAKNLEDTNLLVSNGDIVFMRLTNTPDLEIVFISESINTYGFKAAKLMEHKIPFAKLIHPQDRQNFLHSLRKHLINNFDYFSHSYRLLDKNAQTYWVLAYMIFIKDDDGNITHLYGYLHDITALKKNEEELEALVQKELEKNQEKERLLIQQNKLASMGEMIGAIAHQWRQPLNNVSLILHFIKDNILAKNLSDAELEHYIQRAKKQINYMSDTIDDFRNFYQPSKEKTKFDVKEAIHSTLGILQSTLEKYEITVNITGKSFSLYSFENEFKQAFLNIITNAIDALESMPAGARTVDISLTCKDKKGAIDIYNSGGAAPKRVLERMFEPYFTTKFENKGTGIGLYMTKNIIEKNMDGKITAHNEDKGVRFCLEFTL